MKIKNLKIRQILASSAHKTIEVELETTRGNVRSSVPIGSSVGKYEAVCLPIVDVLKKFSLIKRLLKGQNFRSQEEIDHFLREIDKSSNFKYIGGNLALAVSSSFLKGFALIEGKEIFEFLLKKKAEMPMPISKVVGGGKHGGGSDIQEFLLLPIYQKYFLDSATRIAKCYEDIGKELKGKDPYFTFTRDLESGWTTFLKTEDILNILTRTAEKNGLKIGLDFAASTFWDGKNYIYSDRKLSKEEQINFNEELTKKYPIVYLEDPFHEDDFTSFSILTKRIKPKLVCGDDLLVTNLERLKLAVENKAVNSVIVKPNQIGTITDTIKFVEEAKKNDLVTVISHRSKETEDTLICHLAVGLNCDYIKLGIAGERAVKVNEMIRIEEKLNA